MSKPISAFFVDPLYSRMADDLHLGGMSQRLRRASVSIASNIVEGCARDSEADYLRFLDMAYGSAREVAYQLTIAIRLEYADKQSLVQLESRAVETSKVLNGLIRSLRNKR